ncbi:MAG: ATP-binding protein [Planctomycetaceae bacterium]|nr:ATP-binding protein [Planctomycetaceae bacterium]
MKLKDLKQLLKSGEWNDIEFKEARMDVPKSAFEAVSAFANTHGGWLVLALRSGMVASPMKLSASRNLTRCKTTSFPCSTLMVGSTTMSRLPNKSWSSMARRC